MSSEWREFADHNGAAGLDRQVEGRSLWDFIADGDTRYLYRTLFDQVRRRQRPVTVPFRCDAPETRRFMQLHVRPLTEDSLDVSGQLLREELRERVPLLDSAAPRTDDLLTMCSWCKRIPVHGAWLEVEEAAQALGLFSGPVPKVTHGVCPDCQAAVEEELTRVSAST
jgi:hypothetical protein